MISNKSQDELDKTIEAVKKEVCELACKVAEQQMEIDDLKMKVEEKK